MRRLVAGQSTAEICASEGITPGAYYTITKSDMFKQALGEMEDSIDKDYVDSYLHDQIGLARSVLENHAVSAAQNLVANMTDLDPKIAQTASRDILDRVGAKTAERVEGRMQLTLSEKDADDVRSALDAISGSGPDRGKK